MRSSPFYPDFVPTPEKESVADLSLCPFGGGRLKHESTELFIRAALEGRAGLAVTRLAVSPRKRWSFCPCSSHSSCFRFGGGSRCAGAQRGPPAPEKPLSGRFAFLPAAGSWRCCPSAGGGQGRGRAPCGGAGCERRSGPAGEAAAREEAACGRRGLVSLVTKCP